MSASVLGDALAVRRSKGEVFAQLVNIHRLPVEPEKLWADYQARMPGLVNVAGPDRDALAALRHAGWTLGIITNGTVENQEGKIRKTGLDQLVDGWVISERAGYRKPDTVLFHALADQLACPLRGWMIGDSLELDIEPGAALGLRTAWITDKAPASVTDKVTPDLIAPTVAAAVTSILNRAWTEPEEPTLKPR